MNTDLYGAPFKPLAGLIDPIKNTSDKDAVFLTTPYNDEDSTTHKHKHKKHHNKKSNTKIEKLFIYLAILLCIILLVCILYWIFSNYLFFSLLLVLVSTILYTLIYIANFNDYVENSTTHKKITSVGTIVILVISTLMLLIVVKNKPRFT
jgi:cation transport ATPase